LTTIVSSVFNRSTDGGVLFCFYEAMALRTREIASKADALKLA